MKGKENVKSVVLAGMLIFVLIASMIVTCIPRIEVVTDSLKTAETMLAGTTETAQFQLGFDNQKIGQFWTYKKNGNLNLNVFCAQEGASASSYTAYSYNNTGYDKNSGIWKDETSYKKASWLLSNLWEDVNDSSYKFTDNEKLAILKTVDGSISLADVQAVFNNKNERFKLFQMLTWTYTNGKNVTPSSYISGSTLKVYNAMVSLANKNYNVTPSFSIDASKNVTWNSTNGTYTWGVKITNTYPLAYDKSNNGNTSLVLKVDGSNYTNFTYANNVVTVNGLSNGDHSFEISAGTKAYPFSAVAWTNKYHQNFIEIKKGTAKSPKDVKSATTKEVITNGKYNLQILKVNEDTKQPIENASFKVNNQNYTTNGSGIATVVTDASVTEANAKFTYAVSEVNTANGYLKLADDVVIELTSTYVTEGYSTYYAITDVRFAQNNEKSIAVKTENEKEVILNVDLVRNGGDTTVTLTVPNKEKIYDLALTKTIVTQNDALIDEYDVDRDGKVSPTDGTLFLRLSNVDSIKDFFKNEYNNLYESYYKYFTDDELDLMLGATRTERMSKAQKSLVYYTEIAAGTDVDRIRNVDYENVLNNNGETTSDYILNKNPYEVKVTDEILYKITIYNEGDYDSKNIKITDYLPQGLKVCGVVGGKSTVNYKGNNYIWTVDEVNNTATITIEDILKLYNGKSLDHVDVYIKCKIDENMLSTGAINYDDILYNVTEITSSDAVDSEGKVVPGISDRDSDEGSIVTDTEGNVVTEYKEKFEGIEGTGTSSDSVNKEIYNYQDDDDFERIIIKKDLAGLDLSLRKSITKVGANEASMENVTSKYTYDDEKTGLGNRLPVIPENVIEAYAQTGTGLYFQPKEAVEVKAGDYVEYTIRVFNEGNSEDYCGYAKQITDFLPAGLELCAVVDKDGKWITTQTDGKYKTSVDSYYGGYEVSYDKETNKAVIDYKGSLTLKTTKNLYRLFDYMNKGIEIFGFYNSKEQNPEKYMYQEIKLVCKVTDKTAGKKLTNIAEITDYVATNALGQVIENVTDRDSSPNVSMASKTELNQNKANLDTYYEDRDINDQFVQYYKGMEDDDDFETVLIKVIKGNYIVNIKKVDSLNNEVINGAKFVVNGVESQATVNGIATVANVEFDSTNVENIDQFEISEIKIDSTIDYVKIKNPITVYVKKGYVKSSSGEESCVVTAASFVNGQDVRKVQVELEDGTKVDVTLTITGNVIEVTIPNKPTGFDLSLRKFITKVNGVERTDELSREPIVDRSKLVSGEKTTSEYNHTKVPVEVCPSDLVEYTIRVYNEGKLEGFAKEIMDDIPEGVEMVAPTFDTEGNATNLNAQYRWKMYKEVKEGEVADSEDTVYYDGKLYVVTENAQEANIILTDYLSKANGESMMNNTDTVNPNLLKAFDSVNDIIDYRDIRVEFKVKSTNKADVVITNYAQITKDEYKDGTEIEDIDSTPNKWEDSPRDDDQDIENIKVRYFDLALYKWVSSVIVTEDGKTKEVESQHSQDDKSNVINVQIPKDKLKKTVIKFRYVIKVENQGTLAGYATEVKDHIPEGLKFVAEDNKEYGWSLQEDGTITTNYLKDELLQPQETKEIPVVLTWINGDNNLGVKVNFAEISEDYNEYGDTPDIDSTPNNFVDTPKEDDEDKDEVRLSVKTGDIVNVQYIVLGATVLAIIAGGAVVIKKRVL